MQWNGKIAESLSCALRAAVFGHFDFISNDLTNGIDAAIRYENLLHEIEEIPILDWRIDKRQCRSALRLPVHLEVVRPK